MRAITVAAALLALALGETSASAQTVAIGGGLLFDMQRFPEGATPSRLDGSAVGGVAVTSLQPLPHVLVDAEWTESTITDRRSIGLDIEGRPVTIESAFEHRTRAWDLLAGFAHRLGDRARLAYLLGVSWTEVERRLTTNAPGFVLVPPSDAAAPRSSATTTRFTALAGGIDVLVRVSHHVHALAGVRAQALPLDPDLSGYRLAALAGGAWVF